MNVVAQIIDMCTSILMIQIHVFGYSFSLASVFIAFGVMFLLLNLLYRIME